MIFVLVTLLKPDACQNCDFVFNKSAMAYQLVSVRRADTPVLHDEVETQGEVDERADTIFQKCMWSFYIAITIARNVQNINPVQNCTSVILAYISYTYLNISIFFSTSTSANDWLCLSCLCVVIITSAWCNKRIVKSFAGWLFQHPRYK